MPMKRLLPLTLFAALLFPVHSLTAQNYVKLNGLYAMFGIINPAVEFAVSPHSTVQGEIVFSPWKSIGGKHALFGILMGEYRYYLKGHNQGWYFGGNLSMMGFNMSKPYIERWRIRFENRYCKGFGYMIGACAGYERIFHKRWLVDVYVGWAWMDSFYNGYSNDGVIDMYPHRPVQPANPDPFNGSSEWYPNKLGISIGYRISKPR